jgi:hypothetical protein
MVRFECVTSPARAASSRSTSRGIRFLSQFLPQLVEQWLMRLPTLCGIQNDSAANLLSARAISQCEYKQTPTIRFRGHREAVRTISPHRKKTLDQYRSA